MEMAMKRQPSKERPERKLLVHFLSEHEYNELKKLAIDANETTSQYVTRILREHITRQTK
jgi:hypothetical protein